MAVETIAGPSNPNIVDSVAKGATAPDGKKGLLSGSMLSLEPIIRVLSSVLSGQIGNFQLTPPNLGQPAIPASQPVSGGEDAERKEKKADKPKSGISIDAKAGNGGMSPEAVAASMPHALGKFDLDPGAGVSAANQDMTLKSDVPSGSSLAAAYNRAQRES